jgi:superfamily II DNA/RNA helicase
MTKRKLRFDLGKLSDASMRGVFAKLIAARQVSNAIHTMDPKISLSDSAKQSPKVARLLQDVAKHLEETPDGQVLITTNLVHGGVDVVEQGLKDMGIPFGKFIGKGNANVTEAQRQQDVNLFNQGKHKVLLISSAGGEGINLPNTTMIASLDGHFNPEKINQMEARGIRAGGLAHRPEKERKIIINRYTSIPARSESEVAWNLAKSVNPMTYLMRASKDDKLFQNPFQRVLSIDKEVYRVARRKAVGNKELKDRLILTK